MSLLRRSPLWPGESLPSLLERLAQLNYYPSIHMVERIYSQQLESSAPADYLSCPERLETFCQLAQLTCLSPDDLFAASNHHFALVLPRQSRLSATMPWLGETSKIMLTPEAKQHLRPFSRAQFCPLCLQASAYHRLNWVPYTTAICLEHLCLLENRCPQCQKKLSVSSIVKRHCQACQADLRTAQAISVAEDSQGILSQQTIQSWLAMVEAPETPSGSTLPASRPAMLYLLLENFSKHLLACRQDWLQLPAPLKDLAQHIATTSRTLPSLAPAETFYLHRLTFTSLMDWPQGFFRLLDFFSGYRSLNHEAPKSLHRQETILRSWFRSFNQWLEPEFLQQSLVDYLLDRHIPFPHFLLDQLKDATWFADRTGVWTEERAAQALGLSVQGLHRFCHYGPLDKCLWPGFHSNIPLFQRGQILALQARWNAGWSLSEAGQWLGLCSSDVRNLAEDGLLATMPGKTNEDGPDTYLLNHQSVQEFLEKVAARLEIYSGSYQDLLPFEHVASIASRLGIDRMTLLRGVVDGLLPAYKCTPSLPHIGYIYFLAPMMPFLPNVFDAKRGWVEGHVFAAEYGFSPRLISSWVRRGWIKSVATCGKMRFYKRLLLQQRLAEHLLLQS
jgi:hypothetical protein